MNFLSSEELLRRIIFQKIQKNWQDYLKKWSSERWLKTFTNKFGFLPPQNVEQLPNGFFQCFTDEVNDVIAFKLNISRKELEKYTTSASSLSRFLGKKDDQHKRYSNKKTGLAIFAGFHNPYYYVDSWDDFEAQYQQYMGFWIHWNKNQIHTNQQNNRLLSSSQEEHITSVIIIPNEKPFYQIIYEGSQAEAIIYPNQSKRRKWLLWLILAVLMLVSCFYIFKTFFDKKENLSIQKNNSIPLQENTEDTLIKFSLLQKEEGDGIVSGLLVYDATKYPDDSIKIYLDPYALPNMIKTTKKIDTVPVIFYKSTHIRVRGGTYDRLSIYIPTKSWIGGAYDNSQVKHNTEIKGDISKIYNKPCDLIQNGAVTVAPEQVENKIKDYYFSWFSKTFDKEIQLDTFEIETRVKITYKSKDAICNHLVFKAYDNSFRYAKYSLEVKGCTAYLKTKENLSFMDVSSNQIQNFTHSLDSLKQWNTMKLKKYGSKVDYYWNGKYIGTAPTNNKGIRMLDFTVKSSWAVDWIKISDAKKNIIYQEDFDKCP